MGEMREIKSRSGKGSAKSKNISSMVYFCNRFQNIGVGLAAVIAFRPQDILSGEDVGCIAPYM